MNPNRYTELATAASERYLNILVVFRSLLFKAQQKPFTDASAKALRAQALDVGRNFLRSEMDHIQSDLRDTAIESIRSALTDMKLSTVSRIPNDLEAFLTQSERFLYGELQSQIARDAESLVKRYREFAIEANIIQRTTGKSLGAAIALIGNNASERVRFQFRDRGGRLYSSSKFVRTVWRQTLVCVGAEFYLLEAASRGASKVEIETPDPHSQWSGYQIDLADPTAFLEIRDDAFHPNSNAILKVAA